MISIIINHVLKNLKFDLNLDTDTCFYTSGIYEKFTNPKIYF